MRRYQAAWLTILGVGALLLAGCPSDDGGGGGGGGGGNLPSVPTIRVRANGGNALTGAATNGGHAGGAIFQAANDILLDDGRTRPTVGTNFLDSELGDGTVTWADMIGISAPAIAGGVATFNFAGGTGFNLPSGTTLDFSDAPGGSVDSVEIFTDSNVIIAGTIRLTRATADSVNLLIETSSIFTTPVLVTGTIDGRGSATRDGAQVVIATTGANSGIIFLGSADMSGGAGDAATDAGDGGALIVDSNGDMILRIFGVEARGGDGSAAGGFGGQFGVIADNEITAAFRWGGDMRGGTGGTGNGGDGGILQIVCDVAPTITVFSRAIIMGGDSTGGNGGDGGAAVVGSNDPTSDITGVFYVQSGGGDSVNGNGGNGSFTLGGSVASNATDYRLIYQANGGNGQNGGFGGASTLRGDVLTNVRHEASHNGGDGVVQGGNGGAADISPTGATVPAFTWDGVRLTGSANGGNGGTGNGGNGGQMLFGASGAVPITFTSLLINFDANGGSGVSGGNGGFATLEADGTGARSIQGEYRFDANGGAATATHGGNGGDLIVNASGVDADLLIRGNLSGADALAGGMGGGGGTAYMDASGANGMWSGGDIVINSRGGAAVDGVGGFGGYTGLEAGAGGPSVITNFDVTAPGGSSQTGNGNSGGDFEFFLDTTATITGSTVDIRGGSGSTTSGNGSGGDSGYVGFYADSGTLTVSMNVTADGGSGRGTGNGGGAEGVYTQLDQDGDNAAANFDWSGNVNARGGQAIGAGDGGEGGWFWVEDNVSTSGGTTTVSGTWALSGGASGTMNGGINQYGVLIDVRGNINYNAAATVNGGAGNTSGADGGPVYLATDNNININGSFISNGGAAPAAAGNGGLIEIGDNLAVIVVLTNSTVIRANGAATGGTAGDIILDGIGSPGNVTVGTATLQTNDGDGTDQSATNVVID